jgi:hypothetical protein
MSVASTVRASFRASTSAWRDELPPPRFARQNTASKRSPRVTTHCLNFDPLFAPSFGFGQLIAKQIRIMVDRIVKPAQKAGVSTDYHRAVLP